jgi:hypothetical protein
MQLHLGHRRFHKNPLAIFDAQPMRILQSDLDPFAPRISAGQRQLGQPGQMANAAFGIA